MRNFIDIVIFFLAITCFNSNCYGSPDTSKLRRPYISIDIKDRIRFTNDSIGIENFLISPIDSNKIWTVNTNGYAYELNLVDSSWVRLDHKFGNYAMGLKKENFYKDTENKDLLWIGNFHQGLIIYDISKRHYRGFPAIQNISNFCFLKESVFIGTWHGLYKFSRKSGEVSQISQIAETNVSGIENINDTMLLINNKYLYNIFTNNVNVKFSNDEKIVLKKSTYPFELTAFPDNTLTIKSNNIAKRFSYPYYQFKNIIIDNNCVWIPGPDLIDGIIKYSYPANSIDSIPIGYRYTQYNLVNDSYAIWFKNSDAILFFNKLNYTTSAIQIDNINSIQNLFVDPEFLYTNTWHSIEIFTKDYVISNSFNIDKLIYEETKFRKYIDSLNIYNCYNCNDFISYYRRYKLIQTKFNSTSNKRIKSEIDELKKGIIYRTPNSMNELFELTKTYIDTIKEEEVKASIYLKLVTLSDYEGNLKASLKFDSIIKKNFPGYRTEFYKGRMKEVADSYSIIKKISSSKISEDEKLWKLGNAYYQLFSHVGRETEASSIDMEFPFRYYKKLLKKYPNSPYAANAEFIILRYDEGSSHEGGDNSYNLEAIEKYKELLSKYLYSELTPQIYYQIGSLYSSCDADFNDKPKYYELAKTFILKLIEKYPKYKNIEDAKNLLKDIENSLSEVLWDFEIESDKKEYSPNEAILITYRLKNISEQPKSIKISADKNISNFALWIEKNPLDEHNETYEIIRLERNINEYNKSKKDTLINQGTYYTEKWDIKNNARDALRDAPGYFNIVKEGRYKIISYASEDGFEHSIPSNTIWLNIIKNDNK